MDRLKNPKLIAALVVAALAALVFFQNRAPVELKVLVGTLSTDLATALILAFAAGLVTGFLAFSRWQSQRNKAKAAESTTTSAV